MQIIIILINLKFYTIFEIVNAYSYSCSEYVYI